MRRKAGRATYDRAVIYAILDEALIAAVAVAIDGRPEVQPMIHTRVGDEIVLHGLATNRMLNAISAGAEACINVTLLDGIALARTVPDHSMHYRSATVYAAGSAIDDPAEKARLMEQVFVALVRSDRLSALPPIPANYLKSTMVLRLAISEAVAKVNDSVETGEGPSGIWSGLLPLRLAPGSPKPDARTQEESIEADRSLDLYDRRDRPREVAKARQKHD